MGFKLAFTQELLKMTWSAIISRVISVLVLLSFVAVSSPACTKSSGAPSNPVNLDLTLSKAPKLGESAELTCTVTLKTGDPADNLEIEITLPEGIERVSGDLSWTGDVPEGGTRKKENWGNKTPLKVEINAVVKAVKAGDWVIDAQAGYSPGEASWHGGIDHIYLQVAADSAQMSKTPFPKYTYPPNVPAPEQLPEPQTPLLIQLSLSQHQQPPLLGQASEITWLLRARPNPEFSGNTTETTTAVTVEIELPQGLEFGGGKQTWSGELPVNEESNVEISSVITAVKTGYWYVWAHITQYDLQGKIVESWQSIFGIDIAENTSKFVPAPELDPDRPPPPQLALPSSISIEKQAGIKPIDSKSTEYIPRTESTLYEFYSTGDNNVLSIWERYWSAQTFTPAVAHTIKSVKLKLHKWENLNKTLTVAIKSTDANGEPSGPDLCSGIIPGGLITEIQPGEWYEIPLGAGYPLSAGAKYAIVARYSGTDNRSPIGWRYHDRDATYANGRAYLSMNAGVTWIWGDSGYRGHNVFMFQEWGESTDNATNQTQNIPPNDDINRIDVDKQTGKPLSNESSINTMTPEQQAEIQKQIEEKRKLEDTSQIRFRSGYSIHTTPGTIEAGIQDREKIPPNNYYVIQFYTDLSSVDQDTRDILQQSGCILYDRVPNNAFYAKIPPEALDTVVSLVETGKARYLGYIPIDAKIDQTLLNKAQENPDNSIHVEVHILGDPNQSHIDSLKSLMQIDSYHAGSNFVYGTAKGSSINDIANLNFVKWIAEQIPATLFNNDGTSAITETEIQQPSSKWETFIFLLQQKIKQLWHK